MPLGDGDVGIYTYVLQLIFVFFFLHRFCIALRVQSMDFELVEEEEGMGICCRRLGKENHTNIEIKLNFVC